MVAPIRVMAADDSAVMRGVYRRLFRVDAPARQRGRQAVELCGMVDDGVACLAEARRLRPDVLLLDIEMPRMHGLDVLKRMREESLGFPVILCSASTEHGARVTLEGLALGAKDYLVKPGARNEVGLAMEAFGEQLLHKVASVSRRRAVMESAEVHDGAAGDSTAQDDREEHRVEVVVVGVSTGGPSALERVLPKLPADFPAPVLIAQHIPKLFTSALANRLARCCALPVREAYDGAEIRKGTIWIAPGDAHMEIVGGAAGGGRTQAVVRLSGEGERNFCMPSADVLFRSAAAVYGAGTLAVVMTGMGADGLAGARAVYQAGGTVLAQDESTSAVWGMPGRVYEAGIVRRLLPLEEIAPEIIACSVAPNVKPTADHFEARAVLQAAGGRVR